MIKYLLITTSIYLLALSGKAETKYNTDIRLEKYDVAELQSDTSIKEMADFILFLAEKHTLECDKLLIFIDGTQESFENLKRVKIKPAVDVKVIKGQEAIDMYGEEAINGVVLIDTKPNSGESDNIKQPTFNGENISSFNRWVASKLKYPEGAMKNNIEEGTVMIKLTVDKSGSLRDIKAISSPDKSFEDEAIRVIQLSPLWEPGRYKGVPISISVMIPVKFVK